MVYLLQDSVLPLCNATQLAQIEDHTSEAGREIAADLSLHWKRWMQQEYGLPEEDSEVRRCISQGCPTSQRRQVC